MRCMTAIAPAPFFLAAAGAAALSVDIISSMGQGAARGKWGTAASPE